MRTLSPPYHATLILARPGWLLALLLTGLGTIVQRETMDLEHGMGAAFMPLLNLVHKVALPANLTTLLIMKVMFFLLLWGFLQVCTELEKPVGGLAGALMLALHPMFAANSGRLALFSMAFALFLWGVLLARYLSAWVVAVLLLLVSVIGAVTLSPWLVFLAGLLPCLVPQKNWPALPWKYGFTLAAILIVIGLGIFFSTAHVSDWHTKHVSMQPAGWSQQLYLFGIACQDVHRWGGGIVLALSVIGSILWFPEVFLGLGGLLAIFVTLIRVDLSAIMSLTLIWAVLLALACQGFWDYCWKHRQLLLSNLLLIVVLVALLNSYQAELMIQLSVAKTDYTPRDFFHQCGYSSSLSFDSNRTKSVHTIAPGDDPACWFAFGNYHYAFPGKYLLSLRACQKETSLSYVDVAQKIGKYRITSERLPVDPECSPRALPVLLLLYDTSRHPFAPVEHRIHYGGTGSVYFEGLTVEMFR